MSASDEGHDDAGRIDWRGPALAIAAWMAAWAGTSGSSGLAAGAGLVGLAAAGLGRRRRNWLLVAVGVTGLVVAGLATSRAWLVGIGPIPGWASEHAVVTITARVAGGQTTDGGFGGPLWISTATLLRVEGRGDAWVTGATVRLSASGALHDAWASLPAGTTFRAVVRLSPTEPGEPVSAWAQARDSPTPVTGPGPVDVAVTSVRAGLRAAVAGLPEDPRALVPALVVGDTDGMPEGLTERFRATGLTHLTAVSGANLTLLLAALVWAAARMGVLGWWRRALTVAGVVAFVLLCRSEASVLRAAAMGLVGLAALGWGGARQGLRYLSWAVVGLVIIDPWLARSVGFALSVSASAGIVVWARPWARVLQVWLPAWAAEAITVPVAAQLATQPIVSAISGQVSLVGMTANLVAGPLVGPGTVLGFLAAGTSVLSPELATGFGWAAGGFAQALCWVADAGSALPGATLAWPATPLATVVMAMFCIAVLVGMPRFLRRPWLVALVLSAQVLVLLRPSAPPGWPPGEWQLVSCDVGQGDATVVNVGGGQAIVVDTGPDPGAVDRCLDQLGVTQVSWLILTHLHADHSAGVSGVASGRSVGRLLYSGITEPATNWQAVNAALAGVPQQVAVPGMVVAAGEVEVAVLATRPLVNTGATDEDSADQNDSSLVMRVTVGGLRVLLSGDLEEAGQGNAVARVSDLSADVMLVPHHGSGHQDPAYLAATRAGVALISVGEDNDYGHPAARTVQAVLAIGAQVFRTDEDGSIAVRRAGDQIVVTTSG